MRPRLALLCPGQGDQSADMFALAPVPPDWQLDAALGMPLARALDNAAQLFSNRLAQPLIVAATLAMWEQLRASAPTPTLIAGYSVGELSAAAIAGALLPQDAIHLSAQRATLMDAAATQGGQQGMLAVQGLSAQRLNVLCAQHQVHLAICNGEQHAIVGGTLVHLTGMQTAIDRAGGEAKTIAVHIASHTPCMASAVAPFTAALHASAIQNPHLGLLSGLTAYPIKTREALILNLAQQVAAPVAWAACMDKIAESGITLALELGPGKALSRMLQQRHPHIPCRSVAEFRSVAAVLRWLGSTMGEQ